MRIGIIADTHDRVARAARAVELLVAEGAEVLVHCGDLTGPEVVRTCGRLPGYFVFGNNDFDEDAIRRAIAVVGGECLGHAGEIELGGRRIAVTHGDSEARMRRLLARGPHYLLSGHTHCPADLRVGGTRLINPGALHRASSWTVATLDLATDELRLFEVGDPGRSA